MNWTFGEDVELERLIVETCMPKEGLHPGYVIDVTTLPDHNNPLTTSAGRELDRYSPEELTAIIVHVEWDGWTFTFDLLDDECLPTGETIVVPYDCIDTITVH